MPTMWALARPPHAHRSLIAAIQTYVRDKRGEDGDVHIRVQHKDEVMVDHRCSDAVHHGIILMHMHHMVIAISLTTYIVLE